MGETNGLFIFCEGPHDVAFCSLVLKYFFDLKTVHLKFSEYPFPLNKMFSQNLEKHAARDLTLDMAHKFFLPDRSMSAEDRKQIILLFNIGGKTKLGNPKQFLSDFLTLYVRRDVFGKDGDIIKDIQYLFIFDADHEADGKIFSTCQDALTTINNEPFMEGDFISPDDHAHVAVNSNKAVYILGNPESGKGTLEDILLPVYRGNKPDLLEKSKQFNDECFEWKTGHGSEKDKIAERARRAKAMITAAGQRKRPGRPMTAIIQDDVLGSKQHFLDSVAVQEFAGFIAEFAGLEKTAQG